MSSRAASPARLPSFRPGYQANLLEIWLPALEGMVERLKAGALVADVGCGDGHTTRLMAKASPRSRFMRRQSRAIDRGCALARLGDGKIDNLKFETGSAQDFEGDGFDLVTCFDACMTWVTRSRPGSGSALHSVQTDHG